MWELAFRDDVTLSQSPEDKSLWLQGQNFGLTINKISKGLETVLMMLSQGRVAKEVLVEQVFEKDGPAGMMYFSQYLKRLSRIIAYTALCDGRAVATLTPFSPPSTYFFDEKLIQKSTAYTLSRFAYMRRNESGQLIIESLLGRAQIEVHDPAVGNLFSMFATPHTVSDLATSSGNSVAFTTALMTLLANAQIIAPLGEDEVLAEENDPALAQWEFPDLMFHKHIRLGWKQLPYGGTFRFKDKFPQLPTRKPDLPETVIPLYKPDLEQLAESDPSYTQVVEQRRSIRQYGDSPITVDQLGEFLYRVAAVRDMKVGKDGQWSYTRRPYPNGGALYELEIYPLISRCEGLETGMYYYNPFEHQLHKISERNAYLDSLLEMAWISADRQSRPQVLLNLTARFQVAQWKYQAVGYALMMKHVGVLKQTMYLAATAMGLAPCALGGGNSEVFAAAAGLNPYAETSIGEFLLGSCKEE